MDDFLNDVEESKRERAQDRNHRRGVKSKVAGRKKDASKKEQRRRRRRARAKIQPQDAPKPNRLQWGNSAVRERKAVMSFYPNSIRVLPLASRSRLAHAGGFPS